MKRLLLSLITVVSAFHATAQTSLNPGLVAGCKGSWSFDNVSDLWADGSGTNPLVPKGTAPTVYGTDPLPGDKAILLPAAGVANYLEMNAGLTANGGTKVNAYTLVFDINLVSLSSWKTFWSSQATLTGGTFSNGDGTMFIRTGTGTIGNQALGTLSPSGTNAGYTATALAADTWYRVAFVADLPNSFKIYINGTLVATRTGGPAADTQFALNAGASPNFIFGDNDGDNAPLRCAGIAVWDKALSATEISSLGGLNTVLPVTLTDFSANLSNNQVNLSWTTASEKNSLHYEVLRSTDGKTFSKIGEVKAAGNTDAISYYHFTDFKPENGVNYYQLKQFDKNGDAHSLEKIATAKMLTGSTAISVANLSATSVLVNVYAPKTSSGKLTAVNVNGQKIGEQPIIIAEGNNKFELPLKAAKGLVVITLTTDEGKLSKKIIR